MSNYVPKKHYEKFEVFDSNMLPVPFDGMIVTSMDANEKPLTINFYKDSIIDGVTMSGNLVMTMTLLWTAAGNFTAASTKVLI